MSGNAIEAAKLKNLTPEELFNLRNKLTVQILDLAAAADPNKGTLDGEVVYLRQFRAEVSRALPDRFSV